MLLLHCTQHHTSIHQASNPDKLRNAGRPFRQRGFKADRDRTKSSRAESARRRNLLMRTCHPYQQGANVRTPNRSDLPNKQAPSQKLKGMGVRQDSTSRIRSFFLSLENMQKFLPPPFSFRGHAKDFCNLHFFLKQIYNLCFVDKKKEGEQAGEGEKELDGELEVEWAGGAGVPVCLMRSSLIPQPKWFQLFHLTHISSPERPELATD